MERYQSKQVRINRPAETIYAVMSDFNNFTPIVADKVEEWKATEDSCSFKAKGFKMGLKMIEKEAPKLIKITTDGPNPMDFTVWFQLMSVEPTDTRMRIVMDVKLNPMLKMMIGKKLEGGIDQIAEKIAETFNNAPI